MSMAIQARDMAMEHLSEGCNVMILVPDSTWAPAMFDLGTPPTGIYIRFASQIASLKLLPVDTLICVDSAAIPADALGVARERLRASTRPREIHIVRSSDG